jgi:hypothetical protein
MIELANECLPVEMNIRMAASVVSVTAATMISLLA